MSITESRNLIVKHRIFDLNDIKKVALIIDNLSSTFEANDKKFRVKYSASCFDGSSFTSKDVTLFDQDSILNNKRVESVEVEFISYATDEYIDIRLSHGDTNSLFSNRITVTGSDSNWVNGTLKKLEETLEAVKPQNTFLNKYRFPIHLVLAIGIGTICFWVLSWLPHSSGEPSNEKVTKLVKLLRESPPLCQASCHP